MNKLLLFALTIFSGQLLSNDINKSYFCDDEDRYIYKNISCCKSRVSEEKCDELVDKYIDSKKLELINQVTTDIQNEKWKWGYYPNCFWGVHAFHSKEQAENPKIMSTSKLYSLLKDSFIEVPVGENSSGDIIIFSDNFDAWVWGYQRKREWEPHRDEATHAAVYLEDGFVFQKESQLSAIFSIDTVDHVNYSVLEWMLIPIRRSNEFVTTASYRKVP